MKRILRGLILHPFFFALYPIVALYSYNVSQLHLDDTYRSVALTLAAVAALLLLFWLIMRDGHKAGLAATISALLFFSYGHVYYLLDREIKISPRADVLAAIWAAALILGIYTVGRVVRGSPAGATRFLNVVSAAALVLGSLNGVWFAAHNLLAGAGNGKQTAANGGQLAVNGGKLASTGPAAAKGQPDIYYIILDGFGRPDVMKEIYGVEDLELVDYLKQSGFYVADQSYANYMQTILSVSSSLEYQYIDQILQMNPDVSDRVPLEKLIAENHVVDYLNKRGYKSIMVSSGIDAITVNHVETIYSDPPGNMTQFESVLLSGSLAALYLDKIAPEGHRMTVAHTFTNVVEQVEKPGPKFIFAHILLPHPPFLFDRNGKPVTNTGVVDAEGNAMRAININDGSDFFGDRASYITGYREQLLYTSHQAKWMIEQILARSKTPPVIIVQGDHGPGAFLDWASLDKTCQRERFAILNAYYFPGKGTQGLYPGITPVNSFRVLFNNYFNANLPMLEDKHLFTIRWLPYEYQPVSAERLEEKCPAP